MEKNIKRKPDYFYTTSKNSPFPLFLIACLAWLIAIFLHCHFLMYHPLIHIKDGARCRRLSLLPCLSHFSVKHNLFRSLPFFLLFLILNLSFLYFNERKGKLIIFAISSLRCLLKAASLWGCHLWPIKTLSK